MPASSDPGHPDRDEAEITARLAAAGVPDPVPGPVEWQPLAEMPEIQEAATMPDIRYFASSGTWVKPAGAVRVDIVLKGGDGGAATENAGGDGGGASSAHLASEVIPTTGNVAPANGASPTSGRLGVLSYDAADLPDTVEIVVGKGGRPGGRDGYALIITHLAGQ